MDIKTIFGGVSEYLGKDTTGYFRPSLKGLAVQTSADGRYVAYDASDKRLVDVTGLDFQGLANFVYRVPVAVADVKPGDLIITSENPPAAAFVVENNSKADNTLSVLNPKTADKGTYSPVKNLFGLQFLVKVISPTSGLAGEITDNKLLTLLLLSDKGDGGKGDDLLTALILSGSMAGGSSAPAMFGGEGNILPFLALAKGGDLAKYLLLGNLMPGAAGAKTPEVASKKGPEKA